ncbi:MAG: L-rhamnose mutarotase [Hyphomicrobiales bacterium]
MKRYAHVIGIRPDTLEEYKRLHADVWPDVLDQIRRSNIANYSIFLREPENLLFSYYEYYGTDHDADMAAMANDPRTQEWWKICIPMQKPLEVRQDGEWWAEMPSVFLMEK